MKYIKVYSYMDEITLFGLPLNLGYKILIIYAVKCQEENCLNRGVTEKATVISDNPAWLTESTEESYGFSEVVALTQNYKTQLSSVNKKKGCMPAVCNQWYEFKILGKRSRLHELLKFALFNNKRLPVFRPLSSTVCVLCLCRVL
jgi:hypothetical protein